jgi:hypothetical protein
MADIIVRWVYSQCRALTEGIITVTLNVGWLKSEQKARLPRVEGALKSP